MNCLALEKFQLGCYSTSGELVLNYMRKTQARARTWSRYPHSLSNKTDNRREAVWNARPLFGLFFLRFATVMSCYVSVAQW